MATALIQITAGRLPAVATRQQPAVRRAVISRLHVDVAFRATQPAVSPAMTHVLTQHAIEIKEGADAKITGGTRSLTRRVLALNLAGSLRLPTHSVSLSDN